ncbi:Maf-like protein [Prevotella sp. tf2-5]|jgi:septum formation protein|uniref:Maf-like protein n=1 Tax=Prevotella sp. tf2-5 TaxID=1761889 RepID=UPI0008E048A8|nr:Maf-like protein [Prevotella sp. tf2-5]SFO75015.1 septum formation protein [Prevotella sp. tf2-5]
MVSDRYHIILASNSPRRKELLAGLDIPFDVRVIDGIDESFPQDLLTKDIAGYIAKKKADAYQQTMAADELIITADTIVILGQKVMGKPKDAAEAVGMLHELSGHTHQVITGVCLTTKEKQVNFSVETDVTFKTLTDEEIHYYVEHYRPFDKAGAYGIQEWIGHVGVTGMNGSYFNVMGLPVQRIYEALRMF